MANKQTSVEWLFEQVCNLDWKNVSGENKLKIFEQAKKMHEVNIDNAYKKGYSIGVANIKELYKKINN